MAIDSETMRMFTDAIKHRYGAIEAGIVGELCSKPTSRYDKAVFVGWGEPFGEERRANLLVEQIADDIRAKELEALARALQQIDAGTYGYCVDCGAEISIERLFANLTALRCFDCQTNHGGEGVSAWSVANW